jgi:hypothetical protein
VRLEVKQKESAFIPAGTHRVPSIRRRRAVALVPNLTGLPVIIGNAAVQPVPDSTTETICDHVFEGAEDKGLGHLMSEKNGLVLNLLAEKYLDSARIIIIPAARGGVDPEIGVAVDLPRDHEPYKVIVLDREVFADPYMHLAGVKALLLDGRILLFENDDRPRRCHRGTLQSWHSQADNDSSFQAGRSTGKRWAPWEPGTFPASGSANLPCVLSCDLWHRTIVLMKFRRWEPELRGGAEESSINIEAARRALLNVSPQPKRSRSRKLR